MKIKYAIALLAILVSFAAFGSDETANQPAVKKITDTVEFRALTLDLQKQMDRGGRYEFVKPDERTRVTADLDRIQSLLEKQASGSKLNQNEIADQYTAQNEANAIFHKRDSERVICERRKPTGSNLPITMCNTYSELQHIHDSSQNYMREEQKRSPSLHTDS
jgi:PBP1b-binding outer membrane lipoprotein LpoB